MIEKFKKSKKGVISEEDISTLLQRYSATTVLALLQEVAQFDGVKIDWNALVKKTTTGISNAREYQMLWRHLAYRHALPEKFDHPLDDDDSDLECELESFPSVTSEASAEAAACVKVLIASGLPSDSTHPNNTAVEAPLTINIPNGQSFRATSENSQAAVMRGINIRVPVSVQKLSLPAVTSCAASEVFDANGSGSGSFPPRRKRKPWSEAEDMELIAAVQKLGEGNWANIVRGEFKGDRTASQLSQRWAIIRKRQVNLNAGTISSTPQLSETQRAANDAVKMALDPHPAARSSIASSAGTTSNKTPNNCLPPTVTTEASPAQHQSQQCPMMTKSSSMRPVGSAAKPQVMLAKASAKSILSSDPVRAAAVAAGARIATQSDAASLLKAAQAKNAVRIMPTGSSAIKSSMTGGIPTHLEANPNTRFISSGMPTALTTTHPAAGCPCPGLPKAASPSPQMKASSSTAQHTPSTPVTSLNMLSEQTNSGLAKATSLPPQVKASSLTTQKTQATPITSLNTLSEQTNAESSPKQGIVTIKNMKVFGSQEVANGQVQKDGAHVSVKEPSEHVQEVKAALTNQEAELKSQVAAVESSNASSKLIMNESDLANVTGNQVEGSQNADDNKMTCSPMKEAENQSAVQESGKNQSASEQQAGLPSTVRDESCIKGEGINQTEASNGMLDG